MKRKNSVPLSIGVCIILGVICESADIILWLFNVNTLINIFINVSLAFVYASVYMFVLNDMPKTKSFFIFLIYACIWNFIGLLSSVFSNTTIGEFSPIACLIYAILNTFTIVIYIRNYRERAISFMLSLDSNIRFINFISLYSVFLVLTFMLIDYFYHKVSYYSILLLAISIPVLYALYKAITNVFLRSIDSDKEEQIQLRNEILAKAIHFNNAYESLKEKSRDYRRVVYEHAKDNNSKAIMAFLDYVNFDEEIPYQFSDNKVINEVLSGFYIECKKNGLVFNVKVENINEIFINKEDLYNVLTNSIYGAINAAKKCVEEKLVDVYITQENKQVIINVKNSNYRTIKYYNDIPLGEGFENYGVEAIINISKKYRGYCEFSSDSQYVYTNIVLDNIRIKK